MEPIWPDIVRASTWTVLLTFTVALVSFTPMMAFVASVSSSCGGGYGFVKIPVDFPGESLCVSSHMVRISRSDLFLPSVFAAIMVTASAFLIRSCMDTDNYVDDL
ncbi:unnamed protein product [Cochlearia groenlandica]